MFITFFILKKFFVYFPGIQLCPSFNTITLVLLNSLHRGQRLHCRLLVENKENIYNKTELHKSIPLLSLPSN